MSRNITISTSLDLVTEECYLCHVIFAMPKDLQRRALDAGPDISFYCPNGHSQSYLGKPRTQILEEQLAREKEATRIANERLLATRQERDHHWTELKKTKTRLRNVQERVNHGVCPCCNRTFANLARHMAVKHKTAKVNDKGELL